MTYRKDTDKLIGQIIANALLLHKYSVDSKTSKAIDKILKWAHVFAKLHKQKNHMSSRFGNSYPRYARYGSSTGIIKNGY